MNSRGSSKSFNNSWGVRRSCVGDFQELSASVCESTQEGSPKFIQDG